MQRADVYERRYDESTEQTATNTCPECDGRVTMNTRETVCDDCGLVIADQQVDTGPEWREFEDGPDRRRTGGPRTPTRHDRGLSTTIGRKTDASGSPLPAKKRRQLNRLRRQHARAQRQRTSDRNEMYGLYDIRRMTSALGLGEGLRDRACRLFSTAQQADLLRGRSVEAIAAASVYAACRCDGRPRTVGDIATVARIDEEKLRNGYQVINRELKLPAKPRGPTAFLPRFVSELGLSRAVEQRARTLIGELSSATAQGVNPASIAGGALLVAAAVHDERLQFTQADLAEVAGVTPVTLRRYRETVAAAADIDSTVEQEIPTT